MRNLMHRLGWNAGWRPLLAAFAALYLTAFVLAPAGSYLLNSEEVAVSFGHVFALSLRIQTIVAASVLVLGLLTRSTGRRVLAGISIAVATLLYLQGHVILQNYGPMDGTEIDWASHRSAGIVDMALWTLLLIGFPILALRSRRFVVMTAGAVVLLQATTLGTQLGRGSSFDHGELSEPDHSMMELSSTKNVIIFVLDAFQSTVFDSLLQRDPALADQLSGFTYFEDAMGLYPTTRLSIPAIMTGRVYDNEVPVDDFLEALIPEHTLARKLHEEGYRTTMTTEMAFCEHFDGEPCIRADAFLDWSADRLLYRDALQIWDVTLFRHLPQRLKREVYAGQRWFLQSRLMADHMAGSQKNKAFDFKTDLKTPYRHQLSSFALLHQYTQGMHVATDEPVFQFIHTYITHSPYIFEADCQRLSHEEFERRDPRDVIVDQAACGMSKILDILDRLRELDIYDRSLLVVTADHGTKEHLLAGVEPSDSEPNINSALPLLLIKPFDADGSLQSSKARASLTDIARTVAIEAGVTAEFPGYSLFRERVPMDRERKYFDYEWEHRFWEAAYMPTLQEYIVRGPGKSMESWSLGRELSAAK